MMRWWCVALCAAASVSAQTGGTVMGRVAGEGAGPLRGEVQVVIAAGSVWMGSVMTGDQGEFRIDLPAGPAVLIARAEGYVSEERRIVVRPGAANRAVQFSLAPAGTVSGRVFDESGAGVPGARVWIGYAGEARTWQVADEAGGEAADAFGYFTIPAVARGRPFVLHAESEGRLPSSSGTLNLRTSELSGVVLLLSRRGATVRGRVMDAAGNPVAGADIHLRSIPAEGEFTPALRASPAFAHSTNKAAVSAADGSFLFEAVPAGRVVVTGQTGPRRAVAEGGTLPGRETELVLLLR
jgi:hypothetical protein